MFQDETVQEVSEAILADIQQKVGFKINMNKLMWRLYAQAQHIIENSNKEYRDLAVLYHIADEDNRAYLLVNTEIDFSVTSYDFLVNTIHFGYNLPVIIHGQEILDIMTTLVYTHARNIGYDYFVRKDEANLEEIDKVFVEVEVKPVSARRIAKGATRREELIEKVQWYTLYGLGAVLLLSIGLIIYTYIFNR